MAILLSDIHGNTEILNSLLSNYPSQSVISLGDIGYGFGHVDQVINNMEGTERLLPIPGNHDSPLLIATHPNFKGYWGHMNTECGKTIFWLGGAASVDKKWRTPGVDWWSEEELSEVELKEAIKAYDLLRPDILLTHDAPFMFHQMLYELALLNSPFVRTFGDPKPSRTSMALNEMIKIHQPESCNFAHWHLDINFTYGRTRFQCMRENEYKFVNWDITLP